MASSFISYNVFEERDPRMGGRPEWRGDFYATTFLIDAKNQKNGRRRINIEIQLNSDKDPVSLHWTLETPLREFPVKRFSCVQRIGSPIRLHVSTQTNFPQNLRLSQIGALRKTEVKEECLVVPFRRYAILRLSTTGAEKSQNRSKTLM